MSGKTKPNVCKMCITFVYYNNLELTIYDAANLSEESGVQVVTDFSVIVPSGQVCSLNLSTSFEKLVVANNHRGFQEIV